MKSTFVKNFKTGMSIYGFFICKKIECKLTRLGDEYLDLFLQDKTGTIRGKIWSHVEQFKNKILNDDIVAIKGSIIEYNKSNEINISYISIANEKLYSKYGFKKDSLIIKISENIPILEKYLLESINNKELKIGTEIKSLVNENINKINKIPSLNTRYNLYGGFLLEIVHLLKLNKKLPKIFQKKEDSLIIMGIILKNIGLIQYFNNDMQFSISALGKDSDVKLLSIKLIEHYFLKNEKLKIKLQNFILNESENNDINLKFVNALYDFNNSIITLN